MLQTAYGLFDLKPCEFWNLTPREFHNMMEGHRYKKEIDMRIKATEIYYLMAGPRQKKLPKFDDIYNNLIGRDKKKENENPKETFEELVKTMG